VDDHLKELEKRVALLRGHFQYASGRHGDIYIEKFRILEWPDLTENLCKEIAASFAGKADVVAGPTTGGIIMSYETARHMGLRSIIAERKDAGPGREFKRGFDLRPGERVLVVDDVLTTGGSIREVIDAVRQRGAELVGVGVLVDRASRRADADFGVPFFACMRIEISSWAPEECAQCKEGVPLIVT